MANSKIMDDPRIDPRIKPVFGEIRRLIFFVCCAQPVFKPDFVKSWVQSMVSKFSYLRVPIVREIRPQILQIFKRLLDVKETTSFAWRQSCELPEKSRF